MRASDPGARGRPAALAVALLVALSSTLFVGPAAALGSTVAPPGHTDPTLGGSGIPGAPPTLTVAPGYRPAASVANLGALPLSSPLEVDVGLAMSDPAGFEALLASQYVPGAPMYHDWITPTAFAARFGPSSADLATATAYFEQNGLTVTVSPDHLLLLVHGPAGDVARAFHTSFEEYRGGTGREFFSHSTAATLPAIAPWTGAIGLGNVTPIVPLAAGVPANTPIAGPAASCSGSTEALVPCMVWNAYDETGLISNGTDGAGERVGIVDTYDGVETQDQLESDLASFDTAMSLPSPTVSYNYPIPTTLDVNSTANGWGLEESLDLEWNHAAAPGATIEMTFSPDSGPGLYGAIDWLVSQQKVDVLSLSWGENDVGVYNAFSTPCSVGCNATTDGSYAILSPVLALAAAEGISVFSASGDCGSADGTSGIATNYPASDVSVTGVGGTVLTVNASGSYVGEVAWSGNESGARNPGCVNGGGSGGGFSPAPRPWWQTGTGLPSTPDRRGVPDVSMDAATPVIVVYGGRSGTVGGTSLGVPLWAGIASIADQHAGVDLGLLTPSLYRILSSARYSTDFHDVLSGNNGAYSAGTGWDPVTGIGTPIVGALVSDLARNAPSQSSLRTFLYANPTVGSAPLRVSFGFIVTGGTGSYPFGGVEFGDGNSSLSTNGSAVHTYPTPGVYSAVSFVEDSSGNLSISSPLAIVVGGGALSVELNTSRSAVLVDTPVTLTANVSGGTAPYAYDWSFGDGSYLNWSSGAVVTHTYGAAGGYCAEVVARDSSSPVKGAASAPVSIAVGGAVAGNCTQSLAPLAVTPNPAPGIRDAAADFPDLFTVTGGPTPWNPNNVGLSYSSTDPYVAACGCAILRSAGTYPINVTASDSEDQRASAETNVTVAPPLVASFSASPTHGSVPLFVNFTANGSGGYGLNVSRTRWSSGTGSTIVASSAEFEYSTPGLYLAVGHLSDLGHGNASEAFLIDAVTDGAPSVTATITPAVDVPVGAAVTYSAAAYGSNGLEMPATFLWNLGNGSSWAGPTANETYVGSNVTGATAWNGSLTVSGPAGPLLPPIPLAVPDFSALEAGGFVPRVDALDLSVVGGPPVGNAPLSWKGSASVALGGTVGWTTSNGLVSGGPTPSFVFSSPGSYDVRANASDPYGDHATAGFAVSVISPLAFTGGPSILEGTAPLSVTFAAAGRAGTGPPYSVHWEIANLTSVSTANASYTFEKAGSYFVELTVTDATGDRVFGNWTIVVSAPPGPTPPYGDTLFALALLGGAAAAGVVLAVVMTRRRRRLPPAWVPPPVSP